MDESISTLLCLDGQTALVTGAAGGIGSAIARVLSAAGADVVVADIDRDGADRVAHEIGARPVFLDVTDAVACRRLSTTSTLSTYWSTMPGRWRIPSCSAVRGRRAT